VHWWRWRRVEGDDTPQQYLEKRKAVPVRVSSLSDVVKLAALTAARMAPLPVYRYASDSATVYFVQTVFKDYYRLYGLPIIYYYVEQGSSRRGKYILVKVDEEGEKIEFSEGSRPGWIPIPIVDLSELPAFIPESVVAGERGRGEAKPQR
jgi:hypothetical protein